MRNLKTALKPIPAIAFLLTAFMAFANLANLSGHNFSSHDGGEFKNEIRTLADQKTSYRVSSYNVYLPDNQVGYTLVAKSGSWNPVNYNGSFTFVFTLLESHSRSIPTIKVNGSEVMTDDFGQYQISNITNDKTVTVENVITNVYAITRPWNHEGYMLTTPGYGDLTFSVTHGDSITFTLTLLAGYLDSNPQVTVNEVAVALDVNNQFTISDIREEKTIRVSGVTRSTYSVSVPNIQIGYLLTAKTGSNYAVDYNESFTFVFELLEGYTQSSPRILVNSVEVTLDQNGEYTISEIRQNIDIIVENVTFNAYTITWNIEGETSTSTVNHGVVPTYDGTPIKDATETHIYTFDSWSPTIVEAVEDATYIAVFEEKSLRISSSDPDESAGEVAAELSIPGGIIGDAIIKVRITQSGSETIFVPENKEIFKTYNASLFDSESHDISDTITGEVTLKFATPEGLMSENGIQIIVSGIANPLEATVDDEYVTFSTTSLGDFAIVIDVNNSISTSLIIILSVGGFSLTAVLIICIFFLIKKKQKDEETEEEIQ
ncbi:MAG: hypothetical protein WC215_03690 [Bacilli bacterium]|jgi:hypothetical protein|nr:hypothetical protein [Bacilli bacterium]